MSAGCIITSISKTGSKLYPCDFLIFKFIILGYRHAVRCIYSIGTIKYAGKHISHVIPITSSRPSRTSGNNNRAIMNQGTVKIISNQI